MVEEREVVVIGAGMAGLACAQRLHEARVDFLVLEAADRVGGRVQTDYTIGGGRPFEIGALMIHGKRVVTHAWLREFGLHARPLPTTRRARFWHDGRVVRLPMGTNAFHRTIGLRAFYQGAFTLPKRMIAYEGPDVSLAEWLDQQDALPGARMLVDLLYAHASAADADALGVMGPAEESALAEEEFGYRNFQLVEGYDALLSRRSAPLADRIRLKTRVTAVRRTGDRVRLETRGDRGDAGEVRAKRAVVTLPLGVLKSDSVVFEPPLPEAKRAAIRAIAFGDAMVILLRLRDSDLAQRLGDFGLLWGQGPTSFHRPYVATRNPPDVLDGFLVGRDARRRAALSGQDILELTLEELRAIVPPSVHVGRVDAFACSRWPVHPLIQGGYSFLPPGGTLQHRRDLAAPVDDVLFFAGEATHTQGEPATVHGAIETGYRAAAEALRSLCSA
ncbi:MAG TPA: FAD-dependent oxidoreductase [Thermoplasmata archaeon]|nr:FAD-dependent oxidoreductase [Thermoplasmata archaeon]